MSRNKNIPAPSITPKELIVDRPNGIGYLFDRSDNCFDCILPPVGSPAGVYDYKDKVFSGEIVVTFPDTSSIPVTCNRVPFAHLKVLSAFGKMIEEANALVNSRQIDDSKSGDIPGMTVVNAKGKLEFQAMKPGQTKKQRKEQAKKYNIVDATVVPLAKEVEALKEVGVAEVVNVFDGYEKIKVGDLKKQGEAELSKDHSKTFRNLAYFIGSWIQSEGKYAIVSTPHEVFEKQWPIFFRTERVARFVYEAFLSHEKAKDSVNTCAYFPIHNIADESNEVEGILVTNALQFINSLPNGEEDEKPS